MDGEQASKAGRTTIDNILYFLASQVIDGPDNDIRPDGVRLVYPLLYRSEVTTSSVHKAMTNIQSHQYFSDLLPINLSLDSFICLHFYV